MTEFELLVLAGITIVAGVVSTVAGMGGGIVLLASTTLILPISTVIPLNGVLILGSMISRVWHFHPYINWKVALPFALGSLIGAMVGALTFTLMSEFVISLALSITIIAIIWLPPMQSKLSVPHPFVWIGGLHTWLSAVTGLGGLLQGIMLRSQFSREVIIATIAASMLSMSLLKTAGYVWVGFDYNPYLSAIVVAIVYGFIGTWLGKRCLALVSEAQFRFLLRWLLTLFAIRLFWKSWSYY